MKILAQKRKNRLFGNLLYPVNKELSKKQLGIRRIIHYLYINVIVLGCGYCFKWFFIEDIKRLVSILFLIAAIFVVVSFVMWSGDKRISKELNERLKDYQERKGFDRK